MILLLYLLHLNPNGWKIFDFPLPEGLNIEIEMIE